VRVLIVDDHVLFGDALKMFLDGYEDEVVVVGVARDGREAVDLAVAHDAEVVLLDLSLPLVDGFETARRLLAVKKATKVIAVTGHERFSVLDKVLQSGMVGYLSKDRIHETVLAKIAEVTAESAVVQ